MIKQRILNDIKSTIDKHSRFENYNFKITQGGASRGTSLSIRYQIDTKYYLNFVIPDSETTKDGFDSYYLFTGAMCPGPLAFLETFSFKHEPGIYQHITKWLNSIWEEISLNPVVKLIEDQQVQIDEIFEKIDSMEDGFFTTTEASELKDKLDDLENTLKSQIEKEIQDKKDLEKKISELHADIDTLKQTIHSFNKKGWVKSFAGKVFKWSTNKENVKMIKGGYTLLKEFLPEDVKNILPE